jgi:NAD(P)-dependent dehydrogenase (short-subunit alcohol dehydrogenase family)
MARFTDRVAIVTGASTGLGPVLAKMLAAEGAKVVLAARRIDLVQKAAAEIGDAAVAVKADVTQEADVAAMVDVAMKKWGKVDIMMNNAAGPGIDKYIWEQTLENWNATIAIDVTAAMLCSREVVRRSMMERKTGVIVNFSSSAGQTGIPRKSHYCVAKAGLRILTKVLAKELAEYGIRVNCVVPGAIDTELLRNYHKRIAKERGITYEAQLAEATAAIPMRRFGPAEEFADFAMYLASDQSSYITGQSINCDGGHVMPT